MTRRTVPLLGLLLLVPIPGGAAPPAPTLAELVSATRHIDILEVVETDTKAPSITLRAAGSLKGRPAQGSMILNLSFPDRDDTRALLAWARRGRNVVAFMAEQEGTICIGCQWFAVSQFWGNEWTLEAIRPEGKRTFVGDVGRLIRCVHDLRAGREAVATVETGKYVEDLQCDPVRHLWLLGPTGPVVRVRFRASRPAQEDDRPAPGDAIGRGIDADEVARLLRALQDKNEGTRAAAALDLGLIGAESDTARRALRGALKDEDPFVRLHAVQALARIDPQWPVDSAALRTCLGHKDLEMRIATAAVIGKLGPPARRIAHLLLPGLCDSDARVRRTVACTLSRIGRGVQMPLDERIRVVDTLGTALDTALEREEDRNLVPWLFRALFTQGGDAWVAVPALRKALRSDDEKIAARAFDILTRLDPLPMPVLLEALEDPSLGKVSGMILDWFRVSGRQTTLPSPVLRRKLARTEDPRMRAELLSALFEIEEPRTARELLPTVRSLLAEEDDKLRTCALDLLRKHSPPDRDVAALLRSTLKDESGSARLTAATALLQRGTSTEAVAVLREFL